MRNLEREARIYFASRAKDFWHWADQYRVIEGSKGQTICYREELISILKELQTVGLMPLEAILLIIAAGKESWPITDFMYHTILPNEHLYNYQPMGSAEAIGRYEAVNDVIYSVETKAKPILAALNRIHQLPKSLRSGAHMVHLIKSITTLSIPLYSLDKANFFIQELASGRIPEVHFVAPVRGDDQLETIRHYLSPLDEIQDLEYFLCTGLSRELQPLPTPEPEAKEDELLEQLVKDPKTAGLAQLAKRLIAALNIPPHTRGASDQPLGGVSDISNRGNYDRLLLSELANDDDTLSARLVNNEALYLRRETPPDPQVQERIILVDVSLRLWGIPRVFATAAALGCALNNPQKAKVTAFAVGSEASEPNALLSKEDVLHFLEKLSPALHPGEALKSFFRQNPVSSQQSIFFITSEEVMADKNFALMLAEWMVHLNYLLVLSRSGELWMYKVVNGRRSLLNTTKFDLEEALFGFAKKEGLVKLTQAFSLKLDVFDDNKTRAFLPTHPGRLYYQNLTFKEDMLVAVLPCRRVWFWNGQTKGAIELLETIEEGRYSFHLNEQGVECIIVITNEYTCLAYLFQQHTLAIKVDFGKKIIYYFSEGYHSAPLGYEERFELCSFSAGKLILSLSNVNERGYNERFFVTLDPVSNTLTPLAEAPTFNIKFYRTESLNPIKNIVNNGYSVLRNVKRLGFGHEAYLHLDDFALVLDEHRLWLKKSNQTLSNQKPFLNWQAIDTQFYTKTIEYPNGSKIVLDSRGFLMLFKPSSTQVAVTITLILGKELAAWTHDGYFTGNPYFFNAPADRTVSPSIFYKQYILPFIRKIQ